MAKKKGFMPRYKKPKVRSKGRGRGLLHGVPAKGLLDPSLRRDMGNVPGLAPVN